MALPQEVIDAGKQWMVNHPDVTGVWEGFKSIDGRYTDRVCVVVSVAEKKPLSQVAPSDRIPSHFLGVETDVQEGKYEASALTARRRPCEGGFSCGHYRITAGTFGLPVKRGASDEILLLSNNHVLANSNDAVIGDHVLQPGRADSGSDPNDWFASLVEFATINFPNTPPPKNKSVIASMWWGSIRGVGNLGARLARCPYRVRVGLQAVSQPTPNLVDAAIARPRIADWIKPEILSVGRVQGIRDLVLGDRVQKVGRTTEHTRGSVVGINGRVSVSYGASGTATFEDQVIIAGENGAEFSAGGDSGSAILTEDKFVGGLLFAGGGGQTIANKIAHVVSLLGVRLV